MVSSHFLEDKCAATLRGKMDIIANIVVLGNCFEQGFREIFRMWGREPKPDVRECFGSVFQ